MKPRPLPFLIFIALILAPIGAARAAQLELKSWLGSSFVLPGEETELWLMLEAESRPPLPTVPVIDDLKIELRDDHVLAQRSRRNLYLFQYSILSYQEGTHTIPPFQLNAGGQTVRSQPIEIHVAQLPDGAWATEQLAGQEFRYASAVFVPPRTPYVGETIPAEAKVYLPVKLGIADASIAELEHDGVVAWRFEAVRIPIPTNYASRVFRTLVQIDGLDYTTVTYRSTITALRAGEVSVGPGVARVTVGTQVASRGLTIRRNIATQLPVGARDFEARPLPPGAPPGFDQAVGRFQLAAVAETDGLEEGDPIAVRLSVSGVGNLDTLKVPDLDADPAEWKVYDSSRLPRQGERRDVSGVVSFSQFIRPIGEQREIPSFRLVTFNPESERYETLTTPPIPFSVTAVDRPSAVPSSFLPDLETPVEDMQGILGIIDSPRPRKESSPSSWLRLWHLIPAGIALILLLRIGQLYRLPRLRRPARIREVQGALRDVEQAGSDPRDFLRASGHFIESWIPRAERDEEIVTLLERRDTEAYRPDRTPQPLAPEERQRILQHLRSRALGVLAAVVCMATLVTSVPAMGAAEQTGVFYRQAAAAWNEGSYRAAIEFYETAHPDQDFPADVLYNLGNCYFQLEEFGLAALYYHRALEADPEHPEARQNLRFLKRKTGAITVIRPQVQELLGQVDRKLFTNTLWAGLWLIGLCGLGVLASLPRKLRTVLWSGLALGPLTALTGAAGLYLYPDDLQMAPVRERAIVVSNETTNAHTEASRTSAEVISVPPGSLCRPIAHRGPWTYVELANNTRGWLPSSVIRMIDPDEDREILVARDLGA